MTINQAIILTKKFISNHTELKGWTATLNYRKRAFGVCNYGKRQIELSAHLIPVMTENAIKDTIIHEIAHALTRGHKHDNVWRSKCIELGGNGERVGGSDKYEGGKTGQDVIQQKLAKYTMVCPCCGKKVYKNRKPANKISCGICFPRKYNETYRLSLIQNY